jgi:malonate-semialdehyde dehydrogenase (acetylating)/methylmalonate-semialdehyde dehydrogenase
MYGSEAMHFYTRGKVITSRWPDPAETPAGPDLGFPSSH